jgi:hypothetical protein
MVRHVKRMEEMRSACKNVNGNPGGNRSFGRTRPRWDDNIKIDFREIR